MADEPQQKRDLRREQHQDRQQPGAPMEGVSQSAGLGGGSGFGSNQLQPPPNQTARSPQSESQPTTNPPGQNSSRTNANPDPANEESERKRQIDQNRLVTRAYLRDQINQRTATAAGSAATGAKSLPKRLLTRIIGRGVVGITTRLLLVCGGSCGFYLFFFIIIATIGYIFVHPLEAVKLIIGSAWEGLKYFVGGFFSSSG